MHHRPDIWGADGMFNHACSRIFPSSSHTQWRNSRRTVSLMNQRKTIMPSSSYRESSFRLFASLEFEHREKLQRRTAYLSRPTGMALSKFSKSEQRSIHPSFQFAYNIMSFVLIRLLQTFPSFKLDEAAFPPESRPPAAWKAAPGRKGIERFRPKMHITMFSLVCTSIDLIVGAG